MRLMMRKTIGFIAYFVVLTSYADSSFGANVVEVFSNERAFAALKSDGSVVTWGQGT